MIDQGLKKMLLAHRQKFMIPASMVATVNVTNSLDHAFLILTQNQYAKIVVVDNDNHYRGLISLAMITNRLIETTKINVAKLDQYRVADVMQVDVLPITDPYNVEENLHLLIDQSFLPVVDSANHFQGIVTRRELLKAVNYTVHRFDHYYEVIPKEDE
ncbi:cyclic-di-AMP-binding protein CbpB [Limosilactobacillus sp.]|uniref:cyclic-di-AMP-binding protein CbpB n=1 Tax=Limosilactobacillus sp. TaxID=2773925 RepID=UPI003F0C22C8